MQLKRGITKVIAGITAATIFSLCSPAQAEKWVGSKYSFKANASYTLENGFNLRSDSIEDENGNFTWKIGDDEFYYHGYPVLEWFENIDNQNSIDLNGIDKETKEMLKPYLDDILQESNGIAHLLKDISSDRNLDDTEKQALQLKTEELQTTYTQKLKDIQNTIEGYGPLEKITINDMPLIEVINMFTDFSKFLHYKVEDGRLWAGREFNAAAEAQTDTYFSWETENRQATFEHGITARAKADALAYIDLELKYKNSNFPNIDINTSHLDRYKNLRLPKINIDTSPLDKYSYDLNADAEIGVKWKYDYSIGETYQFTRHFKKIDWGLGMSREFFTKGSQTNQSAVSADILMSDGSISFQKSNWDTEEEIYGDKHTLYSFINKDKGLLWFYAMMSMENTNQTTESETKLKIERTTYNIDGTSTSDNIYDHKKQNKTENYWQFDSKALLGYQLGKFSPFIAYDNNLSGGIISDHDYLKATIYYTDGDPHIDAYLPLKGNNSFQQYLRNMQTLKLSPMFGKDAKEDVLTREHYSKIDGIYLHGRSDNDQYRLGGLLSFNNDFFIEGGAIGFHDHPGDGIYLNLGNDTLMLAGKYIKAQYPHTETYSEELGISASGKIKDVYVDMIYTQENNNEQLQDKDHQIEVRFTIPF